jgi:hypothetical protein
MQIGPMERGEFRNAVFAHLSTEGFVQSYKTQLRLALHKFTSENREFSFPVYQHSLRSEIICNIIADYLKAYSYRDTLHVFMEESAYHKIPQSDIMRQIDISEIDVTILETLMKRKRRPYHNRGVEVQTDQLSINEKLALIDRSCRMQKFQTKRVEQQERVAEHLEKLRQTKEADMERSLHQAFEAQKALEISRAKVQANDRFAIETQRMKAECDAQYLAQSQELRLAREQEEETIHMLQHELDRQLSSLRGGSEKSEKLDDAASIEGLRRRSNAMLNKLLKQGKNMVKLRQNLQDACEEEKLAYQRSLKLLGELREKFAAIHV